jgi:DNA-binding NtrC family response regulator
VSARILIVDDDPLVPRTLRILLKKHGHDVEAAANAEEAFRSMAKSPPEVVISDINMPGLDGFEVLKRVKATCPASEVILVTGYGTIEHAVRGMREGAFDYVTKPVLDDEMVMVVERALEAVRLRSENADLRAKLATAKQDRKAIGRDAHFLKIFETVDAVAPTRATVLITGESGTGKDLVARAIHAGSPRRDSMFLPYNCTSATRELADSQLFGHRRGSFTGAVADQPGVLRTAVGGTLFLDEIGDLPLDVQPKLLRFLEQGEVLPVGDTRPQRVDVRVVAATNADLEQRVADGKFREDLFYRLSVIRIHVPPLRERREEIPHLSTFFLRETCERLSKPGTRLSAETLDIFDTFAWPGNVRQLRNEIQRAVALAPANGIVTPDLLSPVFGVTAPSPESVLKPRLRRTTLAGAVERLEREMILGALEHSGGNISESARQLGLTRRGLYLKLDRLGIDARVS